MRGNSEERRETRLRAAMPFGACGECPRDRHARPAGEELGADPVKRTVVNVGTRPEPPRPLLGAGKAQRQPMARDGGGAFVVVRAGESPVHGEGRQWACGIRLERGEVVVE